MYANLCYIQLALTSMAIHLKQNVKTLEAEISACCKVMIDLHGIVCRGSHFITGSIS